MAKKEDGTVRAGIALSRDAYTAFGAAAKELGISQGAMVEALTWLISDPKSDLGQQIRGYLEKRKELNDALDQARTLSPEKADRLLALIKAGK